MISVRSKGFLGKITKRMKDRDRLAFEAILERHASDGVSRLAAATPVDSGETASAWDYRIEYKNGVYYLTFTNSVIAGNVPVVFLLQYGHATKTGNYIEGIDFINPALKPTFLKINNDVRQEIRK